MKGTCPKSLQDLDPVRLTPGPISYSLCHIYLKVLNEQEKNGKRFLAFNKRAVSISHGLAVEQTS